MRPDYLVGLLRVFFGVVTGALMWAENRSAMMLLRMYYAWGVGMMVISLLSWVRMFSRLHAVMSILPLISSISVSLAFLVAGILYFSLSKRVRNTLGSNLFG